MNNNFLFQAPTLSETEEVIVSECMRNPAVQKYLRLVAHAAASEVFEAIPSSDVQTEGWLRQQFFAKGKLTVLKMLCSIPEVKIKNQS